MTAIERLTKTQSMEAWMGRFEESKVGDVIIVSKIKKLKKMKWVVRRVSVITAPKVVR